MLIYATKLDLARYVTGNPAAVESEAPADALKQLQSASILVRRATANAVYAVDSEGLPTKPSVVGAMRDATCAMAAVFSALSLDVGVGAAGLKPSVSSKSLGSASVTYMNSAAKESAREELASGAVLNSEAYALLRSAGLMNAASSTDYGSGAAWSAGPWPVS